MKKLKTLAAAAAMLALAGTAQASPMTLVDNGLGVLDSAANLEWTASMNLNGPMTWLTANVWIATLNKSYYADHNDWRLPTLNPSDTSCSYGSGNERFGFNCTGGELSNLFVTGLGNKASESVLTQAEDTPEQIANLALFRNVNPVGYWSGTEYAADTDTAWFFYAGGGGGNVNIYTKDDMLYAVAVRTADVAASVPEPQTLALVMLALGAGLLATKRRSA